MCDRDGHLIGILGISREITERRRVEEALRASEAELEQHRRHLEVLVAERTQALEQANARLEQTHFAMDRVGLGIHWVDADGHFIYVNHVAAEMLGYAVEEMLTMSVADIDPGFAKSGFDEATAGIRQSGRASFDTEQQHRDGHLIPVRSVLTTAPKRPVSPHATSLLPAISANRSVPKELREAKEQAESATRAKSSFLANMSHEIRTPMNAILGSVYLMRRAGGDAARSEPLNRIEASSQHLLAIIDDILDLSKIEAGKLALEEAPVSLAGLMNEVAEMLSGRTREKNLNGVH
jgi:PAS domain S-box-containing protein